MNIFEFDRLFSEGITCDDNPYFWGILLLSLSILGGYSSRIYRDIKGCCSLNFVKNNKNINKIEKQCDKNNHLITDKWKVEASYITRHVGSGVVNTIVGFTFIFFAMAMGFSPIVSNVAGYIVGFTLGFVLSKKFVFRSNGHFVAESVRYLIAFVIAFLFNLLVLRLSLVYLNYNVLASQASAAVAYTLLMFILTRFYVFSSPGEKSR